MFAYTHTPQSIHQALLSAFDGRDPGDCALLLVLQVMDPGDHHFVLKTETLYTCARFLGGKKLKTEWRKMMECIVCILVLEKCCVTKLVVQI